MSAQDTEQATSDESVEDTADVKQKSAEEEAAEAEAAAAEVAQRMLQRQLETVGDAEEVCVFLVEDMLDAMFQEMQVLTENALVFARTSAWASDVIFSGVWMGATQASGSLDRPHSPGRIALDGLRQQILKLDEDESDGSVNLELRDLRESKAPQSGDKPELSSSALRFLRRLLAFFDSSSDRVAREFMAFSATQYIQRGVHAKDTSHATSRTRATADWEIPSSSVATFLTTVVNRCHVRVLPSTVSAVCEANAGVIDAKIRTQATLSLSQITHFVRKAVLAAEQNAQEAVREAQQVHNKDDGEVLRRTFETELSSEYVLVKPVDRDSLRLGLQSCYMEEALPVASAIDRSVPGTIAHKSHDAAQPPKDAGRKQLARNVIMALMPGPKETSKWFGLRTRITHNANLNVVQVAVDGDMEMSIDNMPSTDGAELTMLDKAPLSPKKPPIPFAAATVAAASPPTGSRPSKAVGRSFFTATSTKDERAATNRVTIATPELDTATLSNIFSLGTPRQLTGDEMARRHDILAQLEREEIQRQRRLANASIAAMTFPVSSSPSDAEERAFQAYVAANSSVTTGVDFHLDLPTALAASNEEASPPPVAPRRPEQKNPNQSPNRRERKPSEVAGGRSRFEVSLDPPAFTVHDGICGADALTEDTCERNAIKRSPTRRVSHAGSPSPRESSSHGIAATGGISLSPTRPLQSAGQHLPQLDTSRLAVGVRAIMRGVEKRGPRQNPSRQSRLQLHNYHLQAGEDSDEGARRDENEPQLRRDHRVFVPHSPIRSATMQAAAQPPPPATQANGSTYLPLIPPVSPIAAGSASPHRGKHVAFSEPDDASLQKKTRSGKDEDLAAVSPSSGLDQRSAKRKNQQQLVFDKKTVSPPRVRNRHFTGRSKKLHLEYASDYDGDSGGGEENGVGGGRSPDKGGSANRFEMPLEAPRRNLLPSHGH